uniref:CSON003909 protein n=1 Tax=Culicoides sonorensis TaxID=179676 RepID=A0A336KBB9_CULSO
MPIKIPWFFKNFKIANYFAHFIKIRKIGLILYEKKIFIFLIRLRKFLSFIFDNCLRNKCYSYALNVLIMSKLKNDRTVFKNVFF